MGRLVGACGVAVAVLIAGWTPASAVPPEKGEVVVFDADATVVDEFLSDVCGFEVAATIKGHIWETVFHDQAGDVVKITSHPSFRSTLTSPYATVVTADVGLDKFTFNDDGTINIFGTGIHLKLKGETIAIGLWRLVFDPESQTLVSEEYHGNFDVTALEIEDALCEALGP